MGELTYKDVSELVNREIVDYVDDILKSRDCTEVWEKWGNKLSDRRWVNREMDDLVTDVTNFVIYMVQSKRKQLSKGSLKDWVEDFLEGEYAVRVVDDRRYFKDLSPRAQDEVEDDARDHEDLVDDVEDFIEELEDDSRDRDRGRDRGRGRSNSRGRDDDRDRGRGRTSRTTSRSYTPGVRKRRDESSEREEVAEKQERPARVRRERSAPEPVQEKPEETRKARHPGFDGPDHTKPDPYAEFWKGNIFYQLASKSRMFPKPYMVDSNGNALPPFVHINRLHNPLREIRYYAMSQDKIITEEYIPMSRDADYLLHSELGRDRRRVTNEQNPEQVISKEVKYMDPVNVPDESATMIRIGKCIDHGNYTSSEERHVVQSINCVESRARFDMMMSSNSSMVHCQSAAVSTIYIARSQKELEALLNIRNANNLAGAYEMLMNVDIETDDELLNAIDARITEEINHELRSGFGIAINVTSFARYYPELIASLEKKYGAQLVRQFAQISKHIPKTALNIAPAEVKKSIFMDSMNIDENAYASIEKRVTVLMRNVNYVLVDATLDDMSVKFGKMPEIVDGSETINLDKLARMTLAEEDDGIRSRNFILTRDGHRLEVVESRTLPDTVMIRADQ